MWCALVILIPFMSRRGCTQSMVTTFAPNLLSNFISCLFCCCRNLAQITAHLVNNLTRCFYEPAAEAIEATLTCMPSLIMKRLCSSAYAKMLGPAHSCWCQTGSMTFAATQSCTWPYALTIARLNSGQESASFTFLTSLQG